MRVTEENESYLKLKNIYTLLSFTCNVSAFVSLNLKKNPDKFFTQLSVLNFFRIFQRTVEP